ncbi:trypsin-like peptidase domain-containing protein [Mammaliicoccus fleurettii]
MNKVGRHTNSVIIILIMLWFSILFSMNTAHAAVNSSNPLTEGNVNELTSVEQINTTDKSTVKVNGSSTYSQQKETVLPNENKVLEQKTTPIVSNGKVQPKSQTATTKTVKVAPKVVPNKNTTSTPKVAKQTTKQIKAKAPLKTVKSKTTNTKKAQTKKIVTKNKKTTAPSKKKTVKVVSKAKPKAKPKAKQSKTTKKAKTTAKPVKDIKPKVTSKTTKKKTTKPKKLSYYNQAPKAWSSKIPGSDNVRDFGQATKASGIDDALKIMKASGNKGVSISHTKAKAANIATVFNWNPTAKMLTYGTGTAIGKHTILTANHVINNQQAHKPMTPSKVQNLRVNILQEGSKITRTLNVIGVKMMKYGDAALLYTKEDISKYMKIRKIAPEKSINNIKANTPIHMYHYGLPTGKYKKDPMGTMYYSKGKYSLMARNVNPIGYYQMMAEPGSSGGAVLNSKNEVIGVHAFRIDSGDYKKYHLNTMAELRSKLRKEIMKLIK